MKGQCKRKKAETKKNRRKGNIKGGLHSERDGCTEREREGETVILVITAFK